MNTDINEISILYEEMILTESIIPRYPENIETTTATREDSYGKENTIIIYKFTTSKNNNVTVKFMEDYDDENRICHILFTVNGELNSIRTERDIEILPSVIGIILNHTNAYDVIQFSAFTDEKDEQMGKNRRRNIYTRLMDKYFSSNWYIEIYHNDFILTRKN